MLPSATQSNINIFIFYFVRKIRIFVTTKILITLSIKTAWQSAKRQSKMKFNCLFIGVSIILLNHRHLLNQMTSSGKFVNNE